MLAAGAAVVAAAELDSTLAFQLMVSRPIVLGPILGLALGNPLLGAFVGLVVELLSHDKILIGGLVPANATVSVGAGLLLALGPGAVALPVAVPAGLFLGWLHERAVDSPAASARPGGARDRGAPRPRGAVGLGGFVVRELCVQFAVNLALLGSRWSCTQALGHVGLGGPGRHGVRVRPVGRGPDRALVRRGMLAHSLRLGR